MQKRSRSSSWSVPATVVFALPAVALAQSTAPAGESESFLQVLLKGAETPGIIILLMSIAAVTLIIEHFITIRPSTMAPDDEIEKARALIEGRRYKECIETLQASRTMFAHLLAAALQHSRHGFDAMVETLEEATAAWSSRLFRKVEYLNILGNLGPLMGLLGTVVGMIRAFGEMRAKHGAASPEDLAGGISLALVNTFLGLGLAIIALGFFGVCRNRVDRWTVEARAAAMDLLEYFRQAAPPAPSTTAVSAAAPHVTPRPKGESALM